MELTKVGRQVYDRRYGKGQEEPNEMVERVANAVAEPERKPSRRIGADLRDFRLWRDNFALMMHRREFLPNSPTIFGAGLNNMCSACFCLHVEDNLEHIFEVAKMAALVQQQGGGVGYGLSKLRPAGSLVESTGGIASGPVGFMPLYQEVAKTVTQGGRRQGAQMAILHCDHPDVEAFIDCKNDDPEKFSTFNISVAITDEFMQKAIHDPNSKQAALLTKMAMNAHKTGDPGCFFIDAAERANPTPSLGTLDSTNPCGEVPLLHGEACNLGSINLGLFVKNGTIDWTELERCVRWAVRFLDNVVSINQFPHPVITEAVRQTRKIGLGVMGYADMLALMYLYYDTDEAVAMGKQIMYFIQSYADDESRRLVEVEGRDPYPALEKNAVARRNATVTCIAPTGSISILAGASSGIEPHPFLQYDRRVGGTLGTDGFSTHVEEPILQMLKDHGSDFVPRTAHQVAPVWHIAHQAAFQQHVELAVSKTINMSNSATAGDIRTAYELAWERQCKGVTVYRDGSRSGQVISG